MSTWFKVTKNIDSKVKPTRLYLIEMRDDSGHYIKCGKSSGEDSVNRLMSIIESYIVSSNCTSSPYARILRDVEVTDVFKRETEFHNIFKDRRHYPQYEFSGFTEVFAITVEEALEVFDRIVGKEYDRGVLKQCFTCKIEKPTMEFHTNKNKKDGLNHECKNCTIERQRSFKALPTRMYSNQLAHSKYRGHPRPRYTALQLKEWLLKQDKYKELYENYVNSNYDKNLVPSIDRINPALPYSFDNIELVTFLENMKRNGEVQININGEPVIFIDKYSGQCLGTFNTKNIAIKELKLSCKDLSKKADIVLKYGWLATVGDYQFVSVKNYNKFIDNDWLKEEYRYKGNKPDKEKVVEVYERVLEST